MSRPTTAPPGGLAFSQPPASANANSLSFSGPPSTFRTVHTRGMDDVGKDTFRGTSSAMNSTASRMSLYSKNGGDVSLDNTGVVLRVESPISGDLLVTPVARNRPGVRDPVAGAPMRFEGASAVVQTHASANQFLRTRKFYINKDVDITIQTLRNTTKFSKYTNEKVGTAGTPTGMDSSLLFYNGRR